MEENQQTQVNFDEQFEPAEAENSDDSSQEFNIQNTLEGQSDSDPNNDLILGKFKTVEDLSKAYSELQKHQGENSKELGDLRRKANSVEGLGEALKQTIELSSHLAEYLNEYREKYNTPEYFQDTAFRDMYKEAFKALGRELDTDKFVNLLEAYVGSRISSYEKAKSASKETEKILSGMTYDKNSKTSFNPPKKRFDEMTEKEIDEMLDRVI